MLRLYIIKHEGKANPLIRLFKTAAQTLCNSLKGGLDRNKELYKLIHPNHQTTFEIKYVIYMLLVVVTNLWRAFQVVELWNDRSY